MTSSAGRTGFHPKVRVEGRIGRNTELIDKVASGKLDLALAWDDGSDPTVERIATVPLCWLVAADREYGGHPDDGQPLSLAALEAPCMLRTIACELLETHGRAWRIAFVSPGLGGLWAATAAGLGIALRTPIGLPKSVRILDPAAYDLPSVPSLGLVLRSASRAANPLGDHLASIIARALQEVLPSEWLASERTGVHR